MAVLAPNAQATASTGAPSNFISAWPQHWNQIESQVKRLQVRIAKATRSIRHGRFTLSAEERIVRLPSLTQAAGRLEPYEG